METVLSRNLPGRAAKYSPIWPSVQIADRGKWIGTYRVVPHASSNLIVERGRRQLKWANQKWRPILTPDDERLDRAIDPEMTDADMGNLARLDTDAVESSGDDRELELASGRTDFTGDADFPDGDCWRESVNARSLVAAPKNPNAKFPKGCATSSSFRLKGRSCVTDEAVIAPVRCRDVIPEAGIFTGAIKASVVVPVSASGKYNQEILARFGLSRAPPRIAFHTRGVELLASTQLVIS